MSKYNIDNITTTIYDEFFRVLEVLPYNKYRGLVGSVSEPMYLHVTVRDEDELKPAIGKARYPLYRGVFDVFIEGVDKDD